MSTAAAPALSGWLLFSPEDAMSTMKLMARKIHASTLDPYVVRRAREIIAHTTPRDYAAQIAALRQYVEMNFYFVNNPVDRQLIQSPAFMLHDIDARGMTQGACDDAAVLLAALGMSDGIPARIVAYAFGVATGNAAIDNAAPYSHVIADLLDGNAGEWVMLDVTRPEELHRLPDVLRSLPLDL